MRGIPVRFNELSNSDTNARKVLLMTKRFAKMKKSKRGSLLVMVVLILALAIIFISSAMMLTQATKGRLYDNAMSSQARLTVTAASEAFLEALETQEITDDQFDRMLLGPDLNAPKVGQHAMNDRIKMVISGVPGMSGVDGNCTYLDLYYPDASNLSVVHADFTTVIGDETENVQIRLIIDDKEDSNAGSGFSNQVEINSSVGVSQLRFSSGVGMYDGDKYPAGSPRDNTIFCRDNFFENESSNSLFFSDIVVGGDDDGTVFCFGSNTGVYGDMIFLDDAYLSCHASNSYGIHGDLYFLADPHEDMADDDTSFKLFKDGGWSDIANDIKIVFSGRRVQDSTDVWTHGNDGAESDNGKIAALFTGSNSDRAFFVDKSGKSLAVASVGATKKNGGTYTVKNTQLNSDNNKSNTGSYNSEGGGSAYSVTDKVNYYQNTYKANTGTFPTAASVFDEVVMDVKTAPSGGLNNIKFVARSADKTKTYNKGDNIPAGTKYYIPLTETYPFESTDSAHYKTLTLPTNASSGGSTTLAPGYYLITGNASTASTRSSGTKPYVYYIDGSKAEEYRFWFQGGKTFNLNCVVFALYNVSDETAKHSTIFILEEGAQVWLGGQNTNCDLTYSAHLDSSQCPEAARLRQIQ